MTESRPDSKVAERRLHPRVDSDIEIRGAVYNHVGEQVDELQGANLLNVSLGGIAFVSDEPVEVSCHITVTGDKTPSRNHFRNTPTFLILETTEIQGEKPRYMSRCQIIDGEVPIHWMHQHTPQRNI